MAWAATLRTRKVAENRLVRGRRCWIVRRYSTLWRFFCKGYSGAEGPSTVMEAAFTSRGCLAPGVRTTVPATVRAAPTFCPAISL